jgi:hypothetical protein
MNNIAENVEFKITGETNNSINYLDVTITRDTKRMEINVYRKPTSTDTIIHHTSNHPQDHKYAAYRYYINRMITLPNTDKARAQEKKYIYSIQQNIMVFPYNKS